MCIALSARRKRHNGKGHDVTPTELVRAWETAYTRYATAPDTELSVVSREVASAWRDLATVPGLSWWLLSAVLSAAEAFEVQADEWESCSRTQEMRGFRGYGVQRDVEAGAGSGRGYARGWL